ncbi:MAG: site-specific integrase, partial [Clostridiales bacterium]|nr:site-specific integrase [Clostridiales bacterium]
MGKKGDNIYKRKDGRWEGRYPKGRGEDGRLQYGSVYGTRYSDVRDKLDRQKKLWEAQSAATGTDAGQRLHDWIVSCLEG